MGISAMKKNPMTLRTEVEKHLEDSTARSQAAWLAIAKKIQSLMEIRGIFYDRLGEDILDQITANAKERWPQVTDAQATLYFVESLQNDMKTRYHKRLRSGDVWEAIILMRRRQVYVLGEDT